MKKKKLNVTKTTVAKLQLSIMQNVKGGDITVITTTRQEPRVTKSGKCMTETGV